jgi:hypothetical protein
MTTTPERGIERRDDVASLRLFTFADLRSIEVPHGALMFLAIRFFLSRHADRRAYVVVIRGTDGDDEEGKRGSGRD